MNPTVSGAPSLWARLPLQRFSAGLTISRAGLCPATRPASNEQACAVVGHRPNAYNPFKNASSLSPGR